MMHKLFEIRFYYFVDSFCEVQFDSVVFLIRKHNNNTFHQLILIRCGFVSLKIFLMQIFNMSLFFCSASGFSDIFLFFVFKFDP